MLFLTLLTGFIVLISTLTDYQKTISGLKTGLMMFINLLPALLSILAVISIAFYVLPNETIIRYLGKDAGIAGWITAALLGSITLIPGFIAYPLCGVLIKSGVGYSVVSVFITTLMMVGIITLPMEAKFFGWKTSIVRNILFFLAALLIGFVMTLLL